MKRQSPRLYSTDEVNRGNLQNSVRLFDSNSTEEERYVMTHPDVMKRVRMLGYESPFTDVNYARQWLQNNNDYNFIPYEKTDTSNYETEDLIDEIAGFKTVSTRDYNGNIISQKRVAIPLRPEEEKRKNQLLGTINDTMNRMNTLLQDDPEFNIDEPLQKFSQFVNTLTGETKDKFSKLFAKAGIHNFQQNMDSFKSNYVNKFEDEMRLAKMKGEDELLNKGYGQNSSAYQDYKAKMDANLARGKSDMERDSEVYGDRLYNNQMQRDLTMYNTQLESDKANIATQSHVLDKTLMGKQAKLDKRFNELKHLQGIYGETTNDYNNMMNRFNQSHQTLGQFLGSNLDRRANLESHKDNIALGVKQNETARYGIDKQYQAEQAKIQAQLDMAEDDRDNAFAAGMQGLFIDTAGSFLGGGTGNLFRRNRGN